MKKLRIRNILVPIDFSKMSIGAIEAAKRLAKRFDATIHLAHVHHSDFVGPVLSAGFLPESIEEHRRQLAQELKAIAGKSGLGADDQTHVRVGAAPFHEICKLAREVPADLVVIPTHGYTGFKHAFLGTTTGRVVQHSPCPVFVIRQKKRKLETGRAFTPSTILVPVDFSNCSRAGLQYAIGFANEFGARIILLHATFLWYIYSSEGTALYDFPALQEAARKNAEGQMRKLVRAVNFGGVKFETVFTEGAPVSDICAFARDHDVDLTITSTHGLTGLQHVLIGSIAERVVRHAPCSVLVVPSHPQTRIANLAKARGKTVPQRAELRKSVRGKPLTKKDRNLTSHPSPERRKTNKFRESHFRQ